MWSREKNIPAITEHLGKLMSRASFIDGANTFEYVTTVFIDAAPVLQYAAAVFKYGARAFNDGAQKNEHGAPIFNHQRNSFKYGAPVFNHPPCVFECRAQEEYGGAQVLELGRCKFDQFRRVRVALPDASVALAAVLVAPTHALAAQAH